MTYFHYPISTKSFPKAFTLIELLVVVGIIGALIGILIPVLAFARKNSNMTIEGTSLTSITKVMAVYADGNKTYYPGLTNTGKFSTAAFLGQKYAAMPNGSATDTATSNNCCNSFAYAVLMDEGGIAPPQLISPGETGDNTDGAILTLTPASAQTVATRAATTSSSTGLVNSRLNSSYALLAYGNQGLAAEWRGTTNALAPVLSTRLIFTSNASPAANQYSSVWTDAKNGYWKGSIARNDASVIKETFRSDTQITEEFRNLKYGSAICPTGSNSSASECALWAKANTATNGGSLPTNFGTHSATDGTGARGFLGAAND